MLNLRFVQTFIIVVLGVAIITSHFLTQTRDYNDANTSLHLLNQELDVSIMYMKLSKYASTPTFEIGAKTNLSFATGELMVLPTYLDHVGIPDSTDLEVIMESLVDAMPPNGAPGNPITERVTRDWVIHLENILNTPDPVASLRVHAKNLVQLFNSYGSIPGVFIMMNVK